MAAHFDAFIGVSMNDKFAITTLSPKVQFYLYVGAAIAIAIAFSPVIIEALRDEHSAIEPLRTAVKSLTGMAS
jgi:hypothetical protein